MGLLRILGSVGVALGAGAYLASFYAHLGAWKWPAVAVVAAGVAVLFASRLVRRSVTT